MTTEGVTDQGLVLKPYSELLGDIQTDLTNIYAPAGETLNFSSDTPDGQFTNILAQLGIDIRSLARQVYNSFNPDACQGTVQDMRYALNYITRKQGTFTIQNIDVTFDRTVTLNGLDGNYNNVNATSYTVGDNSGQQWFLIDTTTKSAGTYSLPFRSKNYGSYSPAIGTITNQITTVLGVVSVNNSVAPSSYGTEQESDMEFRIRRARSTAIRGQNNLDALQGALLELDGVTDCYVHNNPGSTTDSTGTPANTVWIIVEGGANNDIAALIYQYSCGLPTKGTVSVTVHSVAGESFPTKFDRTNPVPLYLSLDYQSESAVGDDFITELKNYIASNLTYLLNEPAETSKPTCIAKDGIAAQGGTGFPLNVQVSTNGTTWTDFIASSSLQNKFVVSAANISITNTGV